MKIKMQIKALNFLYNLVKGGHCILPSAKPMFTAEKPESSFPEALPEQEGVRSEGLLNLFAALSSDSRVNPHSAVIIRNGKLIARADWEPFSASYPHVSHSLAKTVTGMAVGIAVNEKYISVNETLKDIFGSAGKHLKNTTIQHLLTMSSGAKFNEAGSLMSKNWVEDFLESDVFFESGSAFNYNSMNSFMLSAALCKRTGISLSEYVSRRLFTPMDIKKFYWEKCPSGIEKGGWGLYMSVMDYAKLGQLWLEEGKWSGIRLLPRDWVITASKRHIFDEKICRNGYGFQVWGGKYGIIFSGMFGQLVYVVPKEKMVIVLTAGSEQLFPCGGALGYIESYLNDSGNFSSKPITRFHYSEAAALRRALSSAKFGQQLEFPSVGKSIFTRLKGLFQKSGVTPESVLDGVEITFESNRANLLPLLIQIMEGCFGQGLESVRFAADNERMLMVFRADKETVVIPIGFGRSEMFGYRNFNVGSEGFFTTDEDGYPVLKIQLCFVETSCTKILKFIFSENGVTLKVRENPVFYNAIDEASAMISPELGEGMRKTFEAVLESDIAGYKIKNFMEPTINGKYKLSTIMKK
ncbi:MAG: serine hydrolase [Oscillospiraceae bacterium]|nr:serine hydrolase [Oscillospiraceae bacterium]